MVLVQEYADGGDLYHRLRAGPQQLSEQCAANAVMQPLLGALQYLHSVGIMHRDIKVSRTAASSVALWQYLPSVLLRGVTNGLPYVTQMSCVRCDICISTDTVPFTCVPCCSWLTA